MSAPKTRQAGFTLLIPIRSGNEEALKATIKASNLKQVFKENVHTLHFFAIAVLPPTEQAEDNSWLLMESNFDGAQADFVQLLWGTSHEQLAQLLAYCDLALPDSAASFARLVNEYDNGAGTFFIALEGLTVEKIQRDADVLETAKRWLKENPNSVAKPHQGPRDLCTAIAANIDVDKPRKNAWPRESLRNFYPVYVLISQLALVTFLLLGSGLPRLEFSGHSISQLLLPMWSFLIFLVIAIVNTILAWTPGLYQRKSLNLKPLSLTVMSLLTVAGISYVIYRLSLTSVLGWFLALTCIWLLSIVSFLIRLPTTTPTQGYIFRAVLPGIAGLLALANTGRLYDTNLALAAVILVSGVSLFATLLVTFLRLSSAATRPAGVGTALGLFLGLAVSVGLPVFENTALLMFSEFLFTALLAIVLILVGLLCRLQSQEDTDTETPPYWDENNSRSEVALQEACSVNAQNHLLSLTSIKSGRLRLLALRIILKVVGYKSMVQGTRSELSGITTIHFARWVIIGDSHLLFLSNYAGAWEGYLDEFIDFASLGLSAIWSNTQGFPRTQWLGQSGGARQEQRFKMYARNSQLPTLLHYSAYPGLSVNEVEENNMLHEILGRAKFAPKPKNMPSDAECEAVARLL